MHATEASTFVQTSGIQCLMQSGGDTDSSRSGQYGIGRCGKDDVSEGMSEGKSHSTSMRLACCFDSLAGEVVIVRWRDATALQMSQVHVQSHTPASEHFLQQGNLPMYHAAEALITASGL
jgi:hypothetical protein